MKTVSIGFTRGDGDFAVLATLNNNDDHMRESTFEAIVENLRQSFTEETGEQVVAIERQDTPDYIAI